MNKYIITTATLLAAGTLFSSAIESWIDTTYTKDTEDTRYEYSEGKTTYFYSSNYMFSGTYSESISKETKVDLAGVKIDQTKDARYHLTFELSFKGTPSGGNHASGLLTLVDSGNQVSLLLGNDTDQMCRLGAIFGKDVNASPGIESFVGNSAGSQIWTAFRGNPMTYGAGDYQYHLIFETFADNETPDMIYFGVENESTGQFSYSSLRTDQVGMGGPNNKVWDDIGFNLFGAANGGQNSSTPGVAVVGYDNNRHQSYMTVYERTATAIPEPSAFGLLAGLGALALVGTRRRNRR